VNPGRLSLGSGSPAGTAGPAWTGGTGGPGGPGAAGIRILVAERNQLFLDAIVDTFGLVRDFEVVRTVLAADAVVDQVLRTGPLVVVLGTGGTGYHRLDLARKVLEVSPLSRVVLVAVRPTRALVDRAVAAGVLSVVPTHASLTHLVDAIRGVARGFLTLDPSLFDSADPADRVLGDREREILRLTALGMPTKEIASQLFLSPGTVRNLTSALIKKLSGRNRFEAVRIARERGWVLQPAAFGRDPRGIEAVAATQPLDEHRRQIAHGAGGEKQLAGDVLDRHAPRGQPQDLPLPIGQHRGHRAAVGHQVGVEDQASGRHPANHIDQVGQAGVRRYDTEHAGGDGAVDQVTRWLMSDQHDLARWHGLGQPAHQVEPVVTGHSGADHRDGRP
jgi:two-component system response regulator DesR